MPGSSLGRHLESRVDPGNEVAVNPPSETKMAPGLMPRKVKYLDSNTTGQVELGCRERTTEKGHEL